MKSRTKINVQPSNFCQLLSHFIDEGTVSFDIFKVDGEDQNVKHNRNSVSSNKSHHPHTEHQQSNQTNVRNNSKLPCNSMQNEVNCFESFEVGNENNSNRKYENDLGATPLKR